MGRIFFACALACALFGSAGARAEAQALIMAISAYQGAVPPLKGVTFDVANAISRCSSAAPMRTARPRP